MILSSRCPWAAIAGAAVVFFANAAQDSLVPGQFRLPCLAGKPVLRDALGGLVLLDSEELGRRALAMPSIKVSPDLTDKVSVLVYVGIDVDGSVACADAPSAPKSLRVAAENTAKKWRFQPALDHGKPVRAMGLLEIPVRQN